MMMVKTMVIEAKLRTVNRKKFCADTEPLRGRETKRSRKRRQKQQ